MKNTRKIFAITCWSGQPIPLFVMIFTLSTAFLTAYFVGKASKINGKTTTLAYQNKTGYCKECFGRFILSPKGANASRRDA
ncbi:MAG: hypothetical protein IAX22_08925 [Candidatus Bathyarchaeota archaeon]|nr:hypothetical protein [Candidatus Bathyarchaeota archaeon]